MDKKTLIGHHLIALLDFLVNLTLSSFPLDSALTLYSAALNGTSISFVAFSPFTIFPPNTLQLAILLMKFEASLSSGPSGTVEPC